VLEQALASNVARAVAYTDFMIPSQGYDMNFLPAPMKTQQLLKSQLKFQRSLKK
jgi:hypothetical protein